MEFALERLYHLVNVIVNPLTLKEESLHSAQIRQWIDLAAQEKENIKLDLLRQSLQIKDERSLELLVQQYQAEVIQLLDIVYTDLSCPSNAPYAVLYEALLNHLKAILSHIERRYSKYFNQDEKVPSIYLLVSQSSLQRKIRALKKCHGEVLKHSDMHKVVFSMLDAFVRSDSKVSYRQLLYIKSLLHELETESHNKVHNKLVNNLAAVLIYMNFNTTRITACLIDIMVNAINTIPGQNEKLDKLASCLRELNQVQVKPGVALKQNEASLKDQVSIWILEEMHYLEQTLRLLSVTPVIEKEMLLPEEEKLYLSVSVEVLTLLARSAKDSRLIVNKHMTGMFRNLARFCRTSNTESPSANSMLKKSYVAERSHKEAAINILHDMIKNIHKYCFLPVLVIALL